MNIKKYIIPIIIITACTALLIGFFAMQIKSDGSTLAGRESKLDKLSKLSDTYISCEIKIEDHIISGYTDSNNRHGLAIFIPQGDGKYKFQTNYTRENDEIVVGHAMVNGINYNLFWANKADLDYAEITYTTQDEPPKKIRLNAANNKVLYYEAPYQDYTLEVFFFDIHGNKYE